MSNDIVGPANAPNAVTIRPADTRTFGSSDSWFKDCTSNDVEDGTDIQAGFLNGLLGVLRSVWRINGNRADNVTPVVAELGADDSGLAKALQQLVQRGQPSFGTDTGVANALVVTLSPALVEYKVGLRLYVKVAATNVGGAMTINVNGLGLKSVTRRDGSAPLDADLTAGSIIELNYDGTNFQIPSAFGPGQLVRNLTLYVNGTTGNDANDGTATSPFRTVQRAVDIAWSYGPGPYTVSVNISDGAYGNISTLYRAGPSVVLNGNPVTPSNVVIDGGSNHCVLVNGPNTMQVQNLKVQNSAGASNGGFVAVGGGNISTSNTVSGAITGAVFEAFGPSSISPGNHVFSGNSAEWFWAEAGGSIQVTGGLVFNASTPLSVSYTVLAQDGGNVSFASPSATFVNPGNVSGVKYSAGMCGTINTLGSGTSYLPGNTGGGTTTGGQYA